MSYWVFLKIVIVLLCITLIIRRNYTKTNKNCSKRIRIKNSIHNRMSSTRYSVAITLHALFDNENECTQCENHELDKQTICFYCDSSLASKFRAVDHIYPVIVNRQPSNRLVLSKWNKVVCCMSCNSQKSNHDCIDWMRKKGVKNEKIARIKKRMSKIGFLTTEDYNKLLTKFNHFMKIHEKQCDSLTTLK